MALHVVPQTSQDVSGQSRRTVPFRSCSLRVGLVAVPAARKVNQNRTATRSNMASVSRVLVFMAFPPVYRPMAVIDRALRRGPFVTPVLVAPFVLDK